MNEHLRKNRYDKTCLAKPLETSKLYILLHTCVCWGRAIFYTSLFTLLSSLPALSFPYIPALSLPTIFPCSNERIPTVDQPTDRFNILTLSLKGRPTDRPTAPCSSQPTDRPTGRWTNSDASTIKSLTNRQLTEQRTNSYTNLMVIVDVVINVIGPLYFNLLD